MKLAVAITAFALGYGPSLQDGRPMDPPIDIWPTEIGPTDRQPITVQDGLGLDQLDLASMNAIESKIQTLRAAAQTENQPRGDFTPAPAEDCDLLSVLMDLDARLTQAPHGVQAHWHALILRNNLTDLPRTNRPQECAVYQSLQHLLTQAEAAFTSCQPSQHAVRISGLVSQLSADHQAEFADALSNLARKQAENRQAGLPLTHICPDYINLETRLEEALGASHTQ